jgi:hypothetical protein
MRFVVLAFLEKENRGEVMGRSSLIKITNPDSQVKHLSANFFRFKEARFCNSGYIFGREKPIV